MKKFFFLFVLFAVGAYVFYFPHTKPPKASSPIPSARTQRIQIPTPSVTKNEQMIFVPYWTLSSDIAQNEYDTFVYFGITPGSNGINTSDQGFVDIPVYTAKISPAKTLLAVRMTNKTENEKILESPVFQKQIISDSLAQVKKYGFKGLLLDFEAGGIGFDSLTNQVTGFITDFAKEAKKKQTFFSVAVYADTFYRARPYDIKAIAANADNLVVMAYDFHKAAGDPGPNFPFAQSDADGYSFPQMITDFLQDVPREKLTIAFGLFGYDWQVTDRGDSINTATPISTADIQTSFIASCKFTKCLLRRNPSEEPFVSYTDTTGQGHVIWFEDMQSIHKKIEFLQAQGIGSVAFWANSYF